MDFDIWLGIDRGTDETLDELKNLENIKNVYASKEEMDVKVTCNKKIIQ